MENNFSRRILFILAVLLPALLLYGKDDRLQLKRADILENIIVKGQSIKRLRGNVVITKGDVTLTCDNARYNEKSGQGVLTGNVKIVQLELTMLTDSLHHDSNNDLLMGFGRNHIWDEDFDLLSDTIYYFSELDSGIAMGNTMLTQESQVITADRLSYHKPPEAEAASYTAEGNVVISESERKARCGKAIYAYEDGITMLKLNPVVEENGQTLSGSEIELRYVDEILQSIFIPAEAHVVNVSSGLRKSQFTIVDTSVVVHNPVEFNDDMTSESLRGFFTDGNLDSLRLEGMATTLYHIFEDSVYQGNNTASGDTITMRFAEKELNNIFIAGGARGKFAPDSTNESIEAPIAYQSDIIDYKVENEATNLLGNVNIDYTTLNLNAGYVNVSWQKNLLKALPVTPGDTLTDEITPTINEKGREPMQGKSLTYNLKSRHGKIAAGRTKTGDGYYSGDEIRNLDDKTFYISHSSYTTCDLETPHFHFGGRRMKMISEDKVIARPIILYLAGIPVGGLPLAVFPHQGGTRHSGWIMPSYGENRIMGQFVKGLGYYWAPNDYYDSRILFDFNTKNSVYLRNYNRYSMRYRFSGALNLEMKQSLGLGNKDIANLFEPGSKTDYKIRWTHSQKMRHDQSLKIDAQYQSNAAYNQENGIDLEKRLEQQAKSNLTYSRNWRKSKNSIGLNLSSIRDLMADNKIDSTSDFYLTPTSAGRELNITTSSLPQFTFRHGQSYFFESQGNTKRWYNNISWNYSSSLTNKHRTYFESEEDPDSPGSFIWDDSPKTFTDAVIKHSSSISGPQKIFKYITLNPSLSLQSNWVNKSMAITGLDSSNNQIISREVKGFAARTTGNMNLSLKTQVYGMIPVNIGFFKMLRHTASPSIGYNYKPDFSNPVFGYDFGYFESINDTSGNELLLDRFSGTMAGSTPKTETQSMSFSLANNFQAKLLRDGKETKRDLFSYNLSSSYNFKADEFKLATLNSTVRSKLSEKLKLDLRMTHDFYEFDEDERKRINKIRYSSNGIPKPRLTKVSMSQSFSFTGKRLIPISIKPDSLADTTAADPDLFIDDVDKGSAKPSKMEGDKLWTANFAFSYTLSNPQMKNEVERFQMNSSVNLQLTENWSVKYSAGFNLLNRSLLNQNVAIYRDLHCWEMSLKWVPSGYGRGFYLQISPKAPTLKDLKVEHRGGRHQSPGF